MPLLLMLQHPSMASTEQCGRYCHITATSLHNRAHGVGTDLGVVPSDVARAWGVGRKNCSDLTDVVRERGVVPTDVVRERGVDRP